MMTKMKDLPLVILAALCATFAGGFEASAQTLRVGTPAGSAGAGAAAAVRGGLSLAIAPMVLSAPSVGTPSAAPAPVLAAVAGAPMAVAALPAAALPAAAGPVAVTAGPSMIGSLRTAAAEIKTADAAAPEVLDRLYTNAGAAAASEKAPVSASYRTRRLSGLTPAGLMAGALIPAQAVVAAGQPAVEVSGMGYGPLIAAGVAAVVAGLLGGFRTANMSGTRRDDVIWSMIGRGIFAGVGALMVASVISVPLTFGVLLAGALGTAIFLASLFME